MENAISKANKLGQSIWYDNISRSLIRTGKIQNLIKIGVTGITSNPTIFENAILHSSDYDKSILEAASRNLTSTEIFYQLAKDDIRIASELLRPIYDETNFTDGYVSLEVNPNLANFTTETISEAINLFKMLERPNIMIKVPATKAGIPAIRNLIKEGVNINVTLIFSLDMYKQVMESYIAGLEDRVLLGKNINTICSVASFFVSRIDTAIDTMLNDKIESGNLKSERLLGSAAIANATLAYEAFQKAFNSKRFNRLKLNGANVQKPLWASTGTKNENYSDVRYVESLIGVNTVNTIPPHTLDAFIDHGKVSLSLGGKPIESTKILANISSLGISMESITNQLLKEGLQSFTNSFNNLIDNIKNKIISLSSPG